MHALCTSLSPAHSTTASKTVPGTAVTVVVPHGCCRCCCQAAWCCGHGHGHCADGGESVVTGPQKRKLVEIRKKKTYKQVVSRCKEHDDVACAGAGTQ